MNFLTSSPSLYSKRKHATIDDSVHSVLQDISMHNDTATLVFSNKNGKNMVKNRCLKDGIMLNDMLRDLFSMFQNPLALIFSLEKKLPSSVKGNKNSHLSLLSLATIASFTLK